MDIAYEVGKYLQNAGYGTLATDIFIDQMPAETNGIYVIRSGGMLNNYVPIEETVVDIYTKNTNALEATQTLESIKRYIHRMHSTSIDTAYVYNFLVLGDIEVVQRDTEYAKIMKITLQVIHRDTTLIS